jgi:hypothetical protein
MNSTFQKDTETPVSHEGEYVTDVMAKKAYGLLDDAVKAANKRPFFLTIAPSAPHANIQMNGSALDPGHTFEFSAPIPAERHKNLFKDVSVPRTANFNPSKVCKLKSLFFKTLFGLMSMSIALWSELGLEPTPTKSDQCRL